MYILFFSLLSFFQCVWFLRVQKSPPSLHTTPLPPSLPALLTSVFCSDFFFSYMESLFIFIQIRINIIICSNINTIKVKAGNRHGAERKGRGGGSGEYGLTTDISNRYMLSTSNKVDGATHSKQGVTASVDVCVCGGVIQGQATWGCGLCVFTPGREGRGGARSREHYCDAKGDETEHAEQRERGGGVNKILGSKRGRHAQPLYTPPPTKKLHKGGLKTDATITHLFFFFFLLHILTSFIAGSLLHG